MNKQPLIDMGSTPNSAASNIWSARFCGAVATHDQKQHSRPFLKVAVHVPSMEGPFPFVE